MSDAKGVVGADDLRVRSNPALVVAHDGLEVVSFSTSTVSKSVNRLGPTLMFGGFGDFDLRICDIENELVVELLSVFEHFLSILVVKNVF